jgi:hypothetical protein
MSEESGSSGFVPSLRAATLATTNAQASAAVERTLFH